MNTFIGIGNLGADPVLRTTPSGRYVANFSIAIDRRYYSGEGDDRRLVKEVDWVPVVVWGNLAEVTSQYLQKGSKVSVQGQIRPRSYIDNQNVRHQTFEVVASEVQFLANIRSPKQAVAEEAAM